MNQKNVIKLFSKAIKGKTVSFEKLSKEAYKRGFLVHPECSTTPVLDWIREQPIDYNATFYKEWQDIESKSRQEIWFDQIKNYITNYGEGVSTIPNDGSEQPKYTAFTVILPISVGEVTTRCVNMIYSGVALKQDTLDMIFSIIKRRDIDITLVKNKEAKMIICESTGILPDDPTEFVRYLIYLTTGKSLIIKDQATLNSIKIGATRPGLVNLIESFGLSKLSRVFYRHKKILLALKTAKTAKVINKIRKLAKKNHRPMKPGFFQELLSNPQLVTQLREKLKGADNFTKIRLLQTMNIRNKKFPARFFPVRNGKIWAKETPIETKKYFDIFYPIIYKSLIDSLKEKATTVFVPEGVSYKLPVTEKSYVGNFPLGTSFDFAGKNAILGIHRKAKDAYGYFDFSLNTSNGTKIGWNDSFKSTEGAILFSGDVCHNDRRKPAVELFYAKNGFHDNYIAKANNFDIENFGKEIPYSVFLAIEELDEVKRGYMVDPNSILFNIPLVCPLNTKEVSVGVLAKDKFILAEFRTGNRNVAGKSITNLYADYAIATADCYLDLRKVLLDAGFTFVSNVNDSEIDLSINTISKDSILDILK